MEWQPIETAPKDGTRFIAKERERVFTCFYKENDHPQAKREHTLQMLLQPNSYSSCGRWFTPTHWVPNPPEQTGGK